MKLHMRSLKAGAVVVGIALLLSPSLSQAATMRGGAQFSLGAQETIDDDVYVGAGTSTVAGSVRGDLVIAGGTVMVSGSVGQDVIGAGGNVSLTGAVGDDVRVAGGNVTISSAVTDDLIAAGGSLVVQEGAGVGGDAVMAGGTIEINAPVRGNLQVSGGTVTINSTISGDVTFYGDQITLGPRAVLEKNFTYTSEKEATLQSGAVVRGATDHRKPPVDRADWRAFLGLWFLVKTLWLLVSALFFALVFRKAAQAVVKSSHENFWMELVRGFALLVLIPVAIVVLAVTVIGIPLSVFGVGLCIILFLASHGFAPLVVGSLVQPYWRNEKEFDWVTVLTGVVILSVAGLIPYLGGLVTFLFFLVALGAFGKDMYQRYWLTR